MILFYCLLVGVILVGGTILILGTAQDIHRPQWPAWLLDWAWDRQATPGPDELLRKAQKARHRTDRWALLRRAQGGRS